ncbi:MULTISPECIES: pyridoxamine 5'-phosphate oxidase family protein [Fervidobacterium]|uniref:Pyridoxamine 5'-phosphate oxidase-related FMN-binding n=4 Tax=Fervidobacterium TaxID=2422 RepID=A7HNH6_FERNB|nr:MULTISPECIES: pyridoxamine 5'-phosphate oxidase family protein [Fervidobacterium]ABS61459.1 pyridoxamine 5'-phosphate oxidase-related FMN-binding [Fervidobacterium nodosum Rt17-B1]AFG35780.1 putative flavin-nucleotide-binding protein [Fervidobacterium pennivorans DSM 9078]AMW33306.1 pyridoxamine 5'-phosphate oxidase family protein [Fervidobacterium islandicum]ANE41112.1 pyridoxamine 5'-phosphate oxidase [Fervidobacterium pennivorans]KAF2961092.1 pyridoxamine 5'-phosphate oxidase [Fervidobac
MEKFPPMRRKDRELPEQQTFEILKSGDYGVLATFNGEYPYGIPVNYAFDGEYIYIHCAKEGHKIENIKKFSNVCFTIVKSYEILPDELSTAYESVIAFGKASIVENEDEKRGALELIGKKYSNNLEKIKGEIADSIQRVSIIKIEIEHISGKSRKR